jgi:hypothetical protein
MKRKYFMVTAGGYVQPIDKAYRFEYGGHEFISHKFGIGKAPWRVTSCKVGFRVSGNYQTRKESIKETEKVLDRAKDNLNRYIQDAYDNNKLTIDLFNAVNNPV